VPAENPAVRTAVTPAAVGPAVRPGLRLRTVLLAGVIAVASTLLPFSVAQAADDDEDFNAAFATTPADAERQAQLVQGEDERLIDVRMAGTTNFGSGRQRPYQVRSSGLYTLVLPARKAAYTIDDLRALAPQTFLLQRDGSYLLREHILVDSGATLALSPSRPTTIRMLSSSEGFVSIVSRGGRLRFLGSASAPLTFTSWDETNTAPDQNVTDGRAYVLAQGQLVAKHSTFEHLGFWSGRTGGLALSSANGTDAVNFDPSTARGETGSSTNSRQTEVLPTGVLPTDGQDTIDSVIGDISNAKITGNAFGFFVTGASGVNLRNVTISKSLINGLVLHRQVTSADVEQVLVQDSGADGVVVTRGVEGALLTQLTSTGNGRDGISITGTPLAKGPSSSGASIRQFGNNVVTASLVEANGRTGVRIIGGTKVRLLGNSISGGRQGILITNGAAGVVVDANRVAGVAGAGIQIRNSTGVEVSGNSVRGVKTGVHLTDSAVKLEDNTVAGATLHAISLIGSATGTSLSSNLLSGRGSSAIDMARLEDGEPTLKNNDTSGWKRIITQDGVMSALRHPLTVVWIGVALFILVGQIARHRRRRNPVHVPYIDGPAQRVSAAAIEADQSAALHQPPMRSLSVTTLPSGIEIHQITRAPVPNPTQPAARGPEPALPNAPHPVWPVPSRAGAANAPAWPLPTGAAAGPAPVARAQMAPAVRTAAPGPAPVARPQMAPAVRTAAPIPEAPTAFAAHEAEQLQAEARYRQQQPPAESHRQQNRRQEAERQEAQRREDEWQAVQWREAERQEAARQEAARQEAARQEAARQEAARQQAARQEAARQEAARQEAARPEAARPDAEHQQHADDPQQPDQKAPADPPEPPAQDTAEWLRRVGAL
jgi:hypothetical protein